MTRYRVYGTVQGVGFRPAVYGLAMKLGLKGYVRNNGSNVEICVNDDGSFIQHLGMSLPALAKLEKVMVEDDSNVDYSSLDGFEILSSLDGERGSLIPADTALCDKCHSELFDEGDRRYLYPFINCTECGARYSVISGLPFDRKMTSMNDFPMCPLCNSEYMSPENRRMHAQTMSCENCGPSLSLYKNNSFEGRNLIYSGKKIVGFDISKISCGGSAVKQAAGLIKNGAVLSIMSWGGTHLVSSLFHIDCLRHLYNRGNKPFAVMLKDIDTVKKYAILSIAEEKLLLSPERPIVLLQKKNNGSEWLEQASFGLGNIGVMLPYTPLHHILFHHSGLEGFVVTSGNSPGRPMAITADEAFKLPANYYLVHNRQIIQRVDDSVVRCFEDNTLFIRKSRGYVPSVLDIKHDLTGICVGAELNVNTALSYNKKLFVSQYIGNTEEYDTLAFGEDAGRHMMNILGVNRLDYCGCDMHPVYHTRRLAEKFSSLFSCPLIEIQHHYAHSRTIAYEHNLDKMVCLALDGAGYGDDKTIWGGEVIYSDENGYKRHSSLSLMPLIGGDMATKENIRLIVGLSSLYGIELPSYISDYYDADIREIMLKAASKSPLTSSMGRILDAVSFHLDICRERTYDGEPAMRLEPFLDYSYGGEKYTFEFPVVSDGATRRVQTSEAFSKLFSLNPSSVIEKTQVATGFVRGLVDVLVDEASMVADEYGLSSIGLTGGVAYSYPITYFALKAAKQKGKQLLIHNKIPPGDGGISTGQAIAAMERLKG